MTTSKIASAVSLFALLSLNACVNQVIDAVVAQDTGEEIDIG